MENVKKMLDNKVSEYRRAAVSDSLHEDYRNTERRIFFLKKRLNEIMRTVRRRGRISEIEMKQVSELRKKVVAEHKQYITYRFLIGNQWFNDPHYVDKRLRFKEQPDGIPDNATDIPEQIVKCFQFDSDILSLLDTICMEHATLAKLASYVPEHLWTFANFEEIDQVKNGAVLLIRSKLFPKFVFLARKQPETMEYIKKLLAVEEGNRMDVLRISP